MQELRSFLGLLNYYGKFIPNLTTSDVPTIEDNFHYPEPEPVQQEPSVVNPLPPRQRYPQRIRRPPDRLMYVTAD